MAINISNLLAMPQFRDFKLLTREDYLDLEVTTVNVIDSPDSYKFCKGGEFLITNTFIMQDNPAIFAEIIENAPKLGIAGLGLKLERFMQKLPAEILELANSLRFPIVFIPSDYAFVDIINPVLREIINCQVRQLSFSEMIHNSFTQLVLDGSTITQILETLSQLLHQEAYYFDTVFGETYNSAGKETSELPSLTWSLQNYECFLIELDKRKYGYLALAELKPLEYSLPVEAEYRSIAIEHASTVLKLNIQKKFLTIRWKANFVIFLFSVY